MWAIFVVPCSRMVRSAGRSFKLCLRANVFVLHRVPDLERLASGVIHLRRLALAQVVVGSHTHAMMADMLSLLCSCCR